MLAFSSFLIEPAENVGLAVPDQMELAQYESGSSTKRGEIILKYPHFHLFCCAQLGREMRHGEQWDNAKIIAALPLEKIRTITLEELRELGFSYPY